MFDVKPVKKTGDLDLEKIRNVERILRLNYEDDIDTVKNAVSEDKILKNIHQELFEAREQLARDKFFENFSANYEEKDAPKINAPLFEKKKIKKRDFMARDSVPFFERIRSIDYFGSGKHFAYVSIMLFLIIISAAFLVKGLETRNLAIANGEAAYAKLNLAKEEISRKNYQGSALNFNEAYQKFEEISANMDNLGNVLPETGRFIPFLSKLTTGKYLTEAGKDISKIGVLASELLEGVGQIKNPLNSDQPASFLDIFQKSSGKLRVIISAIESLEKNL